MSSSESVRVDCLPKNKTNLTINSSSSRSLTRRSLAICWSVKALVKCRLKSAGSTAGGFLKGVGSKVFGGLKSAGKSIVNVASKLNPASLLKNGLLGKAAKFIGKAVKGGGLMSVLLGAADLASILTDSSLK